MLAPLRLGFGAALLVVPLVGKTNAFRLDAQFNALASLGGNISGLGNDGNDIRECHLYGVGLNRITVTVLHDAIELYAVPCGVWLAAFGCVSAIFPSIEFRAYPKITFDEQG